MLSDLTHVRRASTVTGWVLWLLVVVHAAALYWYYAPGAPRGHALALAVTLAIVVALSALGMVAVTSAMRELEERTDA